MDGGGGVRTDVAEADEEDRDGFGGGRVAHVGVSLIVRVVL